MPDEYIVKTGEFHPVYTLEALLVLLFCIAAGIGIQAAALQYFHQATPLPSACGAIAGFWLFVTMVMKRLTTEVLLTNERLIYKRGFFFLQSQEVDIEQLASDTIEQSFVGRIFDYGTLRIRCIEASDFWLPPLRYPHAFRNALEQQKHHYRESYMKVERLRRRDGSA